MHRFGSTPMPNSNYRSYPLLRSLRDPHEGGAKNAVESVLNPYDEDGLSPDLDSARGLIPAVVLGVAFWAVILGIALLIWG